MLCTQRAAVASHHSLSPSRCLRLSRVADSSSTSSHATAQSAVVPVSHVSTASRTRAASSSGGGAAGRRVPDASGGDCGGDCGARSVRSSSAARRSEPVVPDGGSVPGSIAGRTLCNGSAIPRACMPAAKGALLASGGALASAPSSASAKRLSSTASQASAHSSTAPASSSQARSAAAHVTRAGVSDVPTATDAHAVPAMLSSMRAWPPPRAASRCVSPSPWRAWLAAPQRHELRRVRQLAAQGGRAAQAVGASGLAGAMM